MQTGQISGVEIVAAWGTLDFLQDFLFEYLRRHDSSIEK